MQRFAIALLTLLLCATAVTSAQTNTSTSQPFVVEYYYKVKWGHQDEFLTLFRKNHLPLLQKQIATGESHRSK